MVKKFIYEDKSVTLSSETPMGQNNPFLNKATLRFSLKQIISKFWKISKYMFMVEFLIPKTYSIKTINLEISQILHCLFSGTLVGSTLTFHYNSYWANVVNSTIQSPLYIHTKNTAIHVKDSTSPRILES